MDAKNIKLKDIARNFLYPKKERLEYLRTFPRKQNLEEKKRERERESLVKCRNQRIPKGKPKQQEKNQLLKRPQKRRHQNYVLRNRESTLEPHIAKHSISEI